LLSGYFAIVIFVFIVLLAVKRMRRSRPAGQRSFRPGPGTAGTIYDLLNEDRRNAIEVIVEDKAAYTEPEHADGNLPDLEKKP
jgi:hypothetical protein